MSILMLADDLKPKKSSNMVTIPMIMYLYKQMISQTFNVGLK